MRVSQQKQATIILGGGLDLVTPAQNVDAGRLLEVKNYECDLNGGYREAAGFERLDGRESPVDTPFYSVLSVATPGAFVIGETLAGGTSGFTAILLSISTSGLYFVSPTGTFTSGEIITGSTSTQTITTAQTSQPNVVLNSIDIFNDVRFLKEIYFRDLIQPVPGINAVRGTFKHLAITLAIRDFDGAEARMYRATPSGWTQITASHVVFYTTRVAPIPAIGTLLDDGVGNTATLHKVGVETIGGVVGYLVLTGYTAGFASASIIEDGATAIATVATGGSASLVTLKPGGKNEWRSHSFSGAIDFYRVYTTDGVNPCMEYDPISDVLAPIYTDQSFIPIDNPTFIDIYKNHLFVGYDRGIMRNSEPGDPFIWDAAAGSLEIAVGSTITGFDSVPSALVVTTSRITYALTGQISDNFVLDVASAKTGAKAYTLQHIGTTYMLDDRGIIELARVQDFGNFANATVSRLIQPALLKIRDSITSSTINLTNNIYKLFTNSGQGVSLTFQEGQIVGFGLYDLNIGINCITNAEDETGVERLLFGGTDGFVYEMDKGVSFDGNEKESWFKTVYQHLATTTQRKRFHRAFFDGLLIGRSSIAITADFSTGSGDSASTIQSANSLAGLKSTWDIGSWDIAVFDSSSSTGNVYLDLTGTGDSISLIAYSKSAKDDLFTMKDVTYHYKLRRKFRGAR